MLIYLGHHSFINKRLFYFQVQLLHCIEQASGEGGDNHFVDGFNVAAKLKENNPEAFEILTSVKFAFNDVGTDEYGEFLKEFERPIIGYLSRFFFIH